MKSFILVAVLACVAVALAEISEVDSRRWGFGGGYGHGNNGSCRRLQLREADDVQCIKRPRRHELRQCLQRCRRCFEEDQLADEVGCLTRSGRFPRGFNWKRSQCVCLSNGEETITTEGPSTELPSTEGPSTEGPSTELPSTEGPSTELPSTEGPSTELPSTEGPSTEVPSTEGPSTTDGGVTEETTEPGNGGAQLA